GSKPCDGEAFAGSGAGARGRSDWRGWNDRGSASGAGESDQRRRAVARFGAVRKDDEGIAAIHCVVEGNEAAGSRSGELKFRRDVHGDQSNYEKNPADAGRHPVREKISCGALRADATGGSGVGESCGGTARIPEAGDGVADGIVQVARRTVGAFGKV